MTDNDDRLQKAEEELERARRDVDEQLKMVHRLEALGQDDAAAQQTLETLLEKLEAAQQKHRAARRDG